MSWLHRVAHFLGRCLHLEQLERELDEEVHEYFEVLIERGMGRGLSREEAARTARIEFEGAEQVKQKVREARMGSAIEKTWQDVRYASRVLKKTPGFTAFAILSMALGLGANAAIFSLVDGVLLKPSGYPDAERIVQLWEKPPGGTRNVISPANYLDWARESRSFASIAAFTWSAMSYTGSGEPQSLPTGLISAQYFQVFGIKPALGRTFAKDEDQPGKANVVVLSRRIWRKLFGSDPSVIGREIVLNGARYTVIGVLPGSSEFDRRPEDIWAPLVFPAHVARDYHYLFAFARLKPGVTLQQAQAEMSAIAAHIAELYPAIKNGWGATVDRYVNRVVNPEMRLSLTVLMWAVAAVLLIGCLNLANLFMARGTLRSREIALRVALGAGRGRMVRMLLTESLLLSFGGAVAGIAVAYGIVKSVEQFLPPFYFPAEATIAIDGRVLLFLAVVAVLTSIAFGLAPALKASHGSSAESLKEGGRSSSIGRSKVRARNVFVAGQVALAFMLLVGAGLLIRSFERLMDVDTGFDPSGVIGADFPMPADPNPNAAKLIEYVEQVIDAVRAAPGVQDAAIASAIPLRGWGDGMPFLLPGKNDERLGSGFKIVTPSYFHTLGLRLLAGRFLDEHDTAGSRLVLVVNESFVKRYFSGVNPIGKHIIVERILPSRHGVGAQAAWEIVGVVADEKSSGLDSPTDIGAYASFLQSPVAAGLSFVARGNGSALTLIKSVERAIWTVNKNQVLDRPMALEQIKADSLASRRIPTILLGGFGTLAMLLACSGIYGVLSFVTARRTQELGIRAALGATRGELVRMVVLSGAVPVVAGIPVGLVCAIALTRWIRSMLFQTTATDPFTLAAVILLFLAVGLIACFVPAWRAAQLDPVSALRQE